MLASVYDVDCYLCYETDVCSSGWAEVCFVQKSEQDPSHKDIPDTPYSLDCMSAFECEPVEEADDPECVPGSATGGDYEMDPCAGWEWAWDISVLADVPPHIVQVRPFPRWIVGMGAPLPAPYESGSPGNLTLQDYPAFSNSSGVCEPDWDGEGCWSHKNHRPDPVRTDPVTGEETPQVGDIKDFRIGLRWRRIDLVPSDGDPGGAPAICWDWDEREWNVGQNYGYGPISDISCGTSVTHIYETSSWGKPRNGPNFIPAEDACLSWTPACDRAGLSPGEEARCHCCEQIPGSMDDWWRLPSGYDFDPDLGPWQNPAYQVKVPTYWALEWAAEWYQWEQVPGCAEGSCGCKLCEDPAGCADRCDCRTGNGEGYCGGENEFCDCDDKYEWKHHNYDSERWHLVDLRNFGRNTWYYTSYAVRTTGSYAGCAYEYGSGGTSVRIPVIEIQSVLRDPCYWDGTCPEK